MMRSRRLTAILISDLGVLRLFFLNPCNRTKRLPTKAQRKIRGLFGVLSNRNSYKFVSVTILSKISDLSLNNLNP